MGRALLLRSSTGRLLLQHHLSQSRRVSPHQGTFGEQSTWSRARASPRCLSRPVPPPQEPVRCRRFYLTMHFDITSCLPGLDEGKLYFLQHLQVLLCPESCARWDVRNCLCHSLPFPCHLTKANGSDIFHWNRARESTFYVTLNSNE